MLNRLKKNSLLSGSAIYLASNIINSAIPFVLIPVLTRYLSPTEYGEIAIFQTLLGALGAFVGASFVGAVSRKFYDSDLSENNLAKFIGACLQLILISSIMVMAVFFIFRARFSEWLGLPPEYIMLAVVVAFCTVIIRLRLGQWQVRKQPISYGTFQVSQSLGNMLLSLLFVVVALQGAVGRINAQVLVSLFFFLMVLFTFKRERLLIFFSWRPDYLVEALKFGVPLIPHIAGAFLLISVDRFVINQELGLVEVGIYMVAVQLAGVMGLVFDAINKAYVPWLFERLKRNEIEEKRQIVKLTYVWFGLVFLSVGAAFLIGPRLVTLIVGEEYVQAGEVIGWLALGQGLRGMYLMVTNFVFYTKKTVFISAITITSGILNVVLLLVLVKHLGIVGAGVAYSISMGFFFLSTWFLATKLIDMPWRLK